jgi:hypothetical protein
MVWCVILKGRIVGPLLFDGTVTGDAYLHMLSEEAFRLHLCIRHNGGHI